MDSPFTAVTLFSDKEIVEANQDILERVTRVLFSVFMDDKPMLDGEMDELLDSSFSIATILMAVCGMSIIGENIKGQYVARFKPYRSVEHFSLENNIA